MGTVSPAREREILGLILDSPNILEAVKELGKGFLGTVSSRGVNGCEPVY